MKFLAGREDPELAGEEIKNKLDEAIPAILKLPLR